jgi:lipid-A-disaccharide synthase
LPIFLESIREIRERIPGAAFVVSSASEERFREIREINLDFSARHGTPPVPVFKGDMNQLIKKSDLVLVASGTATLQTALFGKPMVVAYRVNPITYWIIRSLIRTSFISLVNIIAKRQVVPELIQSQCSSEELARAVIRFHEDPEYRKATVSGLREIQNHVGTPGASFRAAEIIAKCIDESNS